MTEYCQNFILSQGSTDRKFDQTRPDQDRKYLRNQGLELTGTKQNLDFWTGPDQDQK